MKCINQSNCTHMAEIARARANIYGLLSLVYSREPTRELLQQLRAEEFIRVLTEMGLELGPDFFEKGEKKLLEKMVLEWTRLFIGPGRHVSPYESVYSAGDGQRGLLWSEATVEVKNFVRSLGLKYRNGFSGLPDHISVELELMQKLALKEHDCWSQQDEQGAFHCLEISKKFLEGHLKKWIPKFCQEVTRQAGRSFYGQMARLTKEYVLFDSKQVGQAVSVWRSRAGLRSNSSPALRGKGVKI